MATEGQVNDELSPKFPEPYDDEDISDSESEPELSVSLNRPARSKLRCYGSSESGCHGSKSVSQSENRRGVRNEHQPAGRERTSIRNAEIAGEDVLTLLDSSETPPVAVFNTPFRGRGTTGNQGRPQETRRRELSSPGSSSATITNSTMRSSAAKTTDQLTGHTPRSRPGAQARLAISLHDTLSRQQIEPSTIRTGELPARSQVSSLPRSAESDISHFEEIPGLEYHEENNEAHALTQQVTVFTKALEDMKGMVRNMSKQMATLEDKIASSGRSKQRKSPSLLVRVSI